MNDTAWSLAPALGLLLLLAGLAWGAHWLKRRLEPTGSGQGAGVRLVSQLALGAQPRVVGVGGQGSHGAVQLTLGVTPQHVRTLPTQHLHASAAAASPSGAADASSDTAPTPAPGRLPKPATPLHQTVGQAPKNVAGRGNLP